MITEEQVKRLAKEFKIDQYSILREHLQLLFLKHFYGLKESDKVYFKGGTAIHFLYGSFRFSEDLDFTSLVPISTLKTLTGKAVKGLQNETGELKHVNLGIREHSLSEIIKYNYGLKHPLTIRIEFSLREKPITHRASPIETSFPVSAYPLVVHMDVEELLAEKVRAVLTRHKGRDLFDLWFLLSKGIKLKDDYIKNKMRWCEMDYKLSDLISAIEKYGGKGLENDLAKFLPQNYRPFIKDLKEKTLEKLAQLGNE